MKVNIISNTNIHRNNLNFKSTNRTGEEVPSYLIFNDRLKQLKTDEDYKKMQLDQNERMILVGALQFLLLVACAVKYLFNTTSGKRGNALDTSTYKPLVRQFESLKENELIPTVETCKSINKDLKDLLMLKLSLSKQSVKSNSPQDEAGRMLLYGPAGVGKSFFAKIYAKSLDAEYLEVLYSDFNSKWVGEGVENLKEIFEQILAVGKNTPEKKYVVVFNEVDTLVLPMEKLAKDVSSGHYISKIEERSVVLNYLERLKEQAPNVTVIGTTNVSPKGNSLDKAAMSRFQNIIEIPYPDRDCLFEAIKSYLRRMKINDDFINTNEVEIKELASKLEDRKFSFRNLENMVKKSMDYYRQDIYHGKGAEFKMEYLKKGENSVKLSEGELDIP